MADTNPTRTPNVVKQVITAHEEFKARLSAEYGAEHLDLDADALSMLYAYFRRMDEALASLSAKEKDIEEGLGLLELAAEYQAWLARTARMSAGSSGSISSTRSSSSSSRRRISRTPSSSRSSTLPSTF